MNENEYPPKIQGEHKGYHRCAPAARLLSTARRVYSDAHTAATASPKPWPASPAGTLGMESYSPAPLMPAKSSTLAEERAMSTEPLSKAATAGGEGQHT